MQEARSTSKRPSSTQSQQHLKVYPASELRVECSAGLGFRRPASVEPTNGNASCIVDHSCDWLMNMTPIRIGRTCQDIRFLKIVLDNLVLNQMCCDYFALASDLSALRRQRSSSCMPATGQT